MVCPRPHLRVLAVARLENALQNEPAIEILGEADMPPGVEGAATFVLRSDQHRLTIVSRHPQPVGRGPNLNNGTAVPVVAAFVWVPANS